MFEIDKEKCIHCGMCISDCIVNALCFDEEKIPQIDNNKCFKCQHCLAVCPVGALKIFDKNPENSDNILEQEPEKILNLIKSRRSIRQYKQKNLDKEKLSKLKQMLKYIPTGVNYHKLYFSVIDDLDVMNDFRNYVNSKIISIVEKKPFDLITKKFSRIINAIKNGNDIIFRGAPHMIVVSTPIDSPCYKIDPTIALSYFELYAQSMNVGTCWCGYAKHCIDMIPELSEYLEIPQGYKAGYVMLFGEPAVKYSRTTQPEEVKTVSVSKKKFAKLNLTDKLKRYYWNLK